MTDRREGTTREDFNLREMLDNVIHQLDFTKKLMIIMLLSFLIVIPILAVIAYLSQSTAGVGRFIPIIGGAAFLVWLGVGIRQWTVFSRWKRKYQEFKALQKKVEESLDFEKSDKGKSSPN
jgi:energy-coupling factor transporter transmembrane protein EcfT